MKKKKVTPFVQLNRLLQTDMQKNILYDLIEPLNDEYRDDFCLACIAYIRFGIRHHYRNTLINVLFTHYCEVLDR